MGSRLRPYQSIGRAMAPHKASHVAAAVSPAMLLCACLAGPGIEIDESDMPQTPIGKRVSILLSAGDDGWRARKLQDWIEERCQPGLAREVSECVANLGMSCSDSDADDVQCLFNGVSRERGVYRTMSGRIRPTTDGATFDVAVTLTAEPLGPFNVSFDTTVSAWETEGAQP